MNQCNLAKQCIFFTVRDEGKEIREYLAELYCLGNFHECARYRAALDTGQDLVPDEMFPNEDAFLSLFAWSASQRQSPIPSPATRKSASAPIRHPGRHSAKS